MLRLTLSLLEVFCPKTRWRCHKEERRNFPYQAIFCDGHFIGGNNDGRHALKRFSHHLTTGVRTVTFGDVICNATGMVLLGGLP